MAHHQRHGESRTSGIQALLKMFRLPNSTTEPLVGEEDLAAEADEPPDDQLSPLQTSFPHKNSMYTKSPMTNDRRESLLTRALMGESKTEESSPSQQFSRGFSTASTVSNGSMASTAELTSDTGITSPARSAMSSPLLPPAQAAPLPEHLTFSSAGDDATTNNTEAAVEKTLGRKRCVMFACGGKMPQKPKEPVPEPQKEEEPPEPPKRKCMLTFACPSRATMTKDLTEEVLEQRPGRPPVRTDSLQSTASSDKAQPENVSAQLKLPADAVARAIALPAAEDKAPTTPFHEFGDRDDEPDDWINMPVDSHRRLTLTDCMKKEYAIRLIGEEAEEEAEEEEKEEEQLEEGEGEEDDDDADNQEDDFAPSDRSSDGGNESDDEDGFAESDSESEAGSDYQFWSPSRPLSMTTTATSHENINISHIRTNNSKHQSIASSLESGPSQSLQYSAHLSKKGNRRLSPKRRMRPSTPELPDSTDFVCGTLDEDRPLEAAYISCREQKKREKHIPIPQDIDPSFPTTDSEDNDEDQDDEPEDDHLWLKDQLDGFEDEGSRGRRKSPMTMPPPPKPVQPKRPSLSRQTTNRSPPPKHNMHRSPPPHRLFGHSPTRLHSPPPPARLRSPPGSPTTRPMPLGITITRLAQRPNLGRTASLPHTPNPYFRNYRARSPPPSQLVTSGSPSTVQTPKHIRGAVDIVIGLEKKRQKRKAKFWRQHCREYAKREAERKPIPGRGAERMKELGLECAERAKGYGLAQQAQAVVSL